jgi:Rps23 Pro-64 3,4-dihydroxylase Tpa1-like proline 4-hydroxylase
MRKRRWVAIIDVQLTNSFHGCSMPCHDDVQRKCLRHLLYVMGVAVINVL